MRHPTLIVFICLFTCSNVTGQKIDSYKYIYKFQLDKPNEVSNITVDTLQNEDAINRIKGKVTDNKLQALSFLTIIMKSKDTTIFAVTNEKGSFKINANPSTYDLTISGVNYISMTKTVAIDNKINYNLSVILARQAPSTWYDIHSKKELKKDDINKIKKCVEVNKSRPINCGKNNVYFVTMEF
jgi:hypothetical protein